MSDPSKPGFYTSEFWLTLLAVVLAAVQPALSEAPGWASAAGIGLAVLASMGYTAGRARIKREQVAGQ